MKYKGILASSSNPEQLSLTVRGFIIGASSIIVFVGLNFFNVNITSGDVTDLATNVGAVAGGIVAIYGLIMKLVNKVGTE